ncbi:MAG: S8 family serine peptidase [Bradyrhizobium sp.]|nr:S8 family serine peptidase [Bradyrhizobium sp.]
MALIAASAASAQSIMRSPNLNIGARVNPVVNPNPPVGVGVVTTHVNPSVATHATTGVGRVNPVTRTPNLTGRLAVRPQFPYLRTSPNLYPACGGAARDTDGECADLYASSNGNGGHQAHRVLTARLRGNQVQTALDVTTIPNELVAEIDGALSEAQADEMARRHGLRRMQSQNFALIGATIGLFRITDRRSVDVVSREFATEANVRGVQPNFRYRLQDQKPAALGEGDPLQYVLAKMRLPEAHKLAHGSGVKVAVVDSAIDINHPELKGSIVDSFDALGSTDGPHMHGTGIAGAIVSHARLMGSAPAAGIVAIRAFGVATNGAQSNSYVILKALDYAASHGAQVINMSFAGPKDGLIERAVDAVAKKNIVMVAAAGNAGAKSPPLYPAANANVIAVSATDAQDHLFTASNRGGYIAVAAPGVDVFLPAPDGKYQMTSGTSFSAAYVSGLAALMLERNSALKSDELRALLMKSARDLGSPGRDDLFGAGEADAYAAIEAVIAAAPAPVASTSAPAAQEPAENAPEQRQTPLVRPLEPQVSTAASEKPAGAQ